VDSAVLSVASYPEVASAQELSFIDARKQGGERHQLLAFSLSGPFRNYFILLELTLKNSLFCC